MISRNQDISKGPKNRTYVEKHAPKATIRGRNGSGEVAVDVTDHLNGWFNVELSRGSSKQGLNRQVKIR